MESKRDKLRKVTEAVDVQLFLDSYDDIMAQYEIALVEVTDFASDRFTEFSKLQESTIKLGIATARLNALEDIVDDFYKDYKHKIQEVEAEFEKQYREHNKEFVDDLKQEHGTKEKSSEEEND